MKTILARGLGAVALAGVAACSHSQPPPEPIAVAVATAAPAAAQPAYVGPATVEPVHTYRLAFEVPGRVASVSADVGDRVSAGTTLATLDASTYRAEYASAAAQAGAADAQALKAERGSRPEELVETRDAVERAQAADDLARANERRYAQLFAEGAISAQTHDQAVQAARDADAALDAARAQQRMTGEGPRIEDRAAAAASAQAARAQAQLAAITLEKTSIAAPADAYVQSRSIEPGSEAQAGVVCFVLTDARSPQTYADVPERIASTLHVGDAETVIVDGVRHAARIARIEPDADAVTRTRQVRLVSRIEAGEGAVIRVELGGARQRGTAVPLAAVVARGSSSYVMTYDRAASTVARHAVRLIATEGDSAIVDGLSSGTSIVVAGQYEAGDGERVRVVAKDASL